MGFVGFDWRIGEVGGVEMRFLIAPRGLAGFVWKYAMRGWREWCGWGAVGIGWRELGIFAERERRSLGPLI